MWIYGSPSPDMSKKLDLVHALIKKALDVMPMIPVTLRKQIRIEFPYYKQHNVKIVAYIHNLLLLLEYCPNMICDVIELIFENLLLIDVNVTREQIENSEDVDEDEEEESNECDKMRLPVAETLDLCMEKILDFCHAKLREDSETARADQQMITQTLLSYFNEQILKTYTKHVHFVLFYIASFRVSLNFVMFG